MTSLIAWVGANQGFSSIYLASDSRISWGSNTSPLVWDCGRKLFASRNHPEILGYCGDVLFPSQVLAQIVEHIDAGLFFKSDETPEEKSERIFSSLKNSFLGYPIQQSSQVSILYCTRQNIGKKPIIYTWSISWKAGKWERSPLPLPTRSDLILAIGSGEITIRKFYDKWNNSEIGNTSRNVFSAFCDALKSCGDPRSGGAPQLVGLYREGTARSFGVIFNNERYLFGLPVSSDAEWEKVEWRNELFERCNAESRTVLEGAQRHARPTNI
jgi:hypothetical protein